MAYRNQIYVCFDADEDMDYYKKMKMWDINPHLDFEFNNAHDLNNIRVYTEDNIKRNLSERLKNTKLLVVLVGNKTKNLYKFVRWEMEVALKMDIPIVAANLNMTNGMDTQLCPPIIRDELVVYVPFDKDCIFHAMNNWPSEYMGLKAKGTTGWRYYKAFDNIK